MHQAPESMLVMALLNHAGDGAAEATLVVAQNRCRVMRAMALPRRLGRGVMSLLSRASDGTAKATLVMA
jgi:hypothetical protein